MTPLLSEHGASVKDVFHERAWLQSAVDRVQIKFIIECTGSDHSAQVRDAVRAAGVPLLVWRRRGTRGGTAGRSGRRPEAPRSRRPQQRWQPD